MKKRKGLKLWPTMGAKLDDDGLLQMIEIDVCAQPACCTLAAPILLLLVNEY